jgi:hypothetical protein
MPPRAVLFTSVEFPSDLWIDFAFVNRSRGGFAPHSLSVMVTAQS